MAPGCLKKLQSSLTENMLNAQQKEKLHETAYHSIEQGLKQHHPSTINLSDYDTHLREKAATFVTLKIDHGLRGCIGILVPTRALIDDVAHNAYAAAFNDRRFESIKQDELERLTIHISVLNKPEKMYFDSEQDLVSQLQPGIDGIILEEESKKSTFLPSVWESLNNKVEFLQLLKKKAGLPADYWSNSIKVKRYSVESF